MKIKNGIAQMKVKNMLHLALWPGETLECA